MEVADAGVGIGDHRHLDRPHEVILRLPGAVAHRVGELGHQRIVEALEALEVGFGDVHHEMIGHHGAAHTEGSTGVELAHEPTTDLDGL